MEHFTPVSSLAGGILIGVCASAMLGLLGRVAGVSGILGGLLDARANDWAWRLAFVGGLLAGGAAAAQVDPGALAMTLDRSMAALAGAGLLVGFGSRMGSGCTSGHGVCGMARASRRSIVATATFMTTGALTVLAVSRLFGGRI